MKVPPKKNKVADSKSSNPDSTKAANQEFVFCKEYVHYKTGKLMKASDYGYSHWCFLAKKKGA